MLKCIVRSAFENLPRMLLSPTRRTTKINVPPPTLNPASLCLVRVASSRHSYVSAKPAFDHGRLAQTDGKTSSSYQEPNARVRAIDHSQAICSLCMRNGMIYGYIVIHVLILLPVAKRKMRTPF